MICPTCKTETYHTKITLDGERCHACGGFAQAGGVPTQGILSRNSHRVNEESLAHEADMLPPHIYDPVTRKKAPNPEFIKRYPDKAHLNYTADELVAHKFPKLAAEINKRMEKKKDPGVKFRGNTKEAVRNAIKNAK